MEWVRGGGILIRVLDVAFWKSKSVSIWLYMAFWGT